MRCCAIRSATSLVGTRPAVAASRIARGITGIPSMRDCASAAELPRRYSSACTEVLVH